MTAKKWKFFWLGNWEESNKIRLGGYSLFVCIEVKRIFDWISPEAEPETRIRMRQGLECKLSPPFSVGKGLHRTEKVLPLNLITFGSLLFTLNIFSSENFKILSQLIYYLKILKACWKFFVNYLIYFLYVDTYIPISFLI